MQLIYRPLSAHGASFSVHCAWEGLTAGLGYRKDVIRAFTQQRIYGDRRQLMTEPGGTELESAPGFSVREPLGLF